MSQGFIAILFNDPFAVMNTTGLVALALVGSSKAIHEEFDLFEITIAGLAMAFAGGATRDLLGNNDRTVNFTTAKRDCSYSLRID